MHTIRHGNEQDTSAPHGAPCRDQRRDALLRAARAMTRSWLCGSSARFARSMASIPGIVDRTTPDHHALLLHSLGQRSAATNAEKGTPRNRNDIAVPGACAVATG